MKFGTIPGGGATAPLDPKRVEPSQTRPTENKPELDLAGSEKVADSTQLSSDAVEISRYQEMVNLHREAFGSVQELDRSDKLNEIRGKIADGYYNSDEAIEKLASRLVENTLSDAGKASNLEDVQRRKDEGYYNRPAVIDKTADNMLKHVISNKYVK